MSPIVIAVTGALIISWAVVIGYSKMFDKDETVIEKKLEEVIEHNVENALNLPEGSLDGKLGFMVQPVEEDKKD